MLLIGNSKDADKNARPDLGPTVCNGYQQTGKEIINVKFCESRREE